MTANTAPPAATPPADAQPLPSPPSLWGRFFDWNWEPNSPDLTIHSKSRLLNRTLLLMFFIMFAILPVNLYADFFGGALMLITEYIAIGFMFVASGIALRANRLGHYKFAARLAVGSSFVTMLIISIGFFVSLNLLIAVIIMAAMFLPSRQVLILGALTFAVTLVNILGNQPSTQVSHFQPMFFFLIVLPMLFAYMIHTHNLEQQRRAELEKANAQLRESETLLERRVEARTRELEKAMEELRALDSMKSQFLASMSHELRTPLNAILNFTEFVSIGMLGPVNEKQVDVLNKSLDSGRHLLALINDVLDITKIESGMMKLFIEDDVDLNEELRPVIATAETLLQDKPIQLVLDIDADLPTLSGDKRRIRQIMLNLLSNAIKFTEAGTVTLSVKRRKDDVLFAVIDTGPGIKAEDQQLVFEPFQQTETGVKHAAGTGLGLPISLRLAQAHGGDLWLESEPDDGAAFYFTLPIHGTPNTDAIVQIA